MNTRRKILMVDDNETNLHTCKAILRDTYSVYTAMSAASMFEVLANVLPDLILLDVMMPDMDGYAAMKRLKESEEYRDIPVIFVTALSNVETELEGLELGAADYVTKPFFPPILLKRIETHIALAEKTRQLENASRSKSRFLRDMSHEMRGALSTVIGLTRIALDSERLDEEMREKIIMVHRAGKTLLSLTDDILDISKVEAGILDIRPAEYDVGEMLRDAVSNCTGYMSGKQGINFTADIGADVPRALNGDKLRVSQVMCNLLSNALKYTEKGTVKLSLSCSPSRVDDGACLLTIKVSDTGDGMKPADMKELFGEHFMTGRGVEGSSGLGLYITRKIAGLMGGEIRVESEYGEGSMFTAVLPQKRAGDELIDGGIASELEARLKH